MIDKILPPVDQQAANIDCARIKAGGHIQASRKRSDKRGVVLEQACRGRKNNRGRQATYTRNEGGDMQIFD